MPKAVWNGARLARSDDPVVVEGNHYFPRESVRQDYLHESASHTICPWKGEASYYDVAVGGAVNKDTASDYPEPKDAAKQITDRIAFWKGVEVR